ncbi:unnamed protein product, partial [Ixodes pacificus]
MDPSRGATAFHRPSFTQEPFINTTASLPNIRKATHLVGFCLIDVEKQKADVEKQKAACRLLLKMFSHVVLFGVHRSKDVLRTPVIFLFFPGLGYTLLASVPPVFALYNAMFPMMIYIILGTVRQASVGADAIMSMMTGGVVRGLVSQEYVTQHAMVAIHNATSDGPYTVTQVTSALCFTIGIIQLVFSFLSLGQLNVFLSEQMVNGFATGVAVQVVISQLGSIFGNHVPHISGMFTIYKTLYAFFANIHEVAWQTTLVAFVAIAVIMTVKLLIDPPFVRKLGIPIPIELMVVVFFTLGSHYLNLRVNYGVDVVGTIPEKLPEPTLPSFNPTLIASILPESFALAIVSFAITLSLGRIFGQKHGYQVDANQ